MSDDQTREPDQPEQPEVDKAPLEDPDAELHEGDAGSEHLPGESYRNTLRLN
ncbi:hypothetical protein GCM10011519_31730 [Marmoricola endophyticus]|uniref:Uncharacterized protein n=1 Tax=Marmoricola endophyticus TaxID=2040280 RepID=A0A917BSX3_9ACTN|nr:hypothetical protein [Marmoricola endophyticus]GGF55498.1 hypothetical protein GCM10011519_31730 [Marmoricola endophyticus]